MYGVKYRLEFATLHKSAIKVDLLLKNYSGEVIPLVGMDSPLTICSEEPDFLYNPVNKSNCTISIWANNYMHDLFSTDYKMWKVYIYKDEAVIWSGYITPELYTQDYSSSKFQLDLEAVSSLSVLENIPYPSGLSGYKTIREILKIIIQESGNNYDKILIPNTYILPEGYEGDVLDLLINQENFYNEDGESLFCLEVVEEICKFLNWTCTDWSGNLYFIDYDYSNYTIYDNNFSKISTTTGITYDIQSELNFAGSNQTLDIVGGYSKTSVRSNSYSLASLKTNFNNLKNIGEALFVYESSIYMKWILLEDSNNTRTFKYNLEGKEITTEEFLNPKNTNILTDTLFSCLGKSFSYARDIFDSQNRYTKNSITYIDAVLVRTASKRPPFISNRDPGPTYYLPTNSKILKICNPNIIKYPRGAFSIDFKIETMVYRYTPFSINTICPVGDTNGMESIKCSLRIGKYYYSSKGWVKTPSTFNIKLNDSSPMGIKSNKKLFEGPNEAKGYIVDLYGGRTPSDLIGDMEFIIYASTEFYTRSNIGGYSITNFSINFDSMSSNSLSANKETDRLYENIVNSSFITELDTIDFKINTYNESDGLSLSNVLVGDDYLQSLPNTITDKNYTQEELLINRIINQYKKPKIKLSQQLKSFNVSPIDNIKDFFSPGNYSPIAINNEVAKDLLEIKMLKNERS